MSEMSDYLENEIVKHIFRTGTFTKPTTLYFALYTAMPTDAGGGTEVTGGSYARVGVTPSDANFDATSGSDGKTANTNTISFPAPTANWGTIVGMAVLDASSGGNFLFFSPLTTSKTVNSGDPAPTFQAGDFTFTIA